MESPHLGTPRTARMLVPMRRLTLSLLLLVACRGSPTTVAPDPTPTKTSAAPSQTPPPPSFDDLRVTVSLTSGHSYAIEVSNVGKAPIDVAHLLDVEKLGDAGWTSVLHPDAHLELDCSREKCTTLAAGATLHPGAWWVATNGCVQDQCVCMDGGPCIVDCLSTPALPGRYRVVARSCDGGRRWESTAFEVPAPP